MVGFELPTRVVLTAAVATALCSVAGGQSSSLDLRVAKGMYTRPYNTLRVSTIGDGRQFLESPAYTRQFEHRWTTKTLSTKLVDVALTGTTMQVGKEHVHLRLPPPGTGVTGLLLSDPCFTSRGGLHCPDAQLFHILGRLVELLNMLLASDEFHFWAILGDNFYDRLGDVSSEFFGQLSLAARSKPLMTVVGNHDLWLSGSPPGMPSDQLGYGFVQFYGQDTAAAAGPSSGPPYNLRSNPNYLEIPPAENFIFGTQLGDLAFFGYSAAHDWAATLPHVVAFCAFAGSESSVHAIVLLGHWDSCNLGCQPEMDTPSVYRKMKALDGCSIKQMLYFLGHQHCNRVNEGISGPLDAYGFMVGGLGMLGVGCEKQFGLTVLQSDPLAPTGPNVRVDHFPITEGPLPPNRTDITYDCFDDIARCLNTSGYGGCRTQHGVSFRATSTDSYVGPENNGLSPLRCRPFRRTSSSIPPKTTIALETTTTTSSTSSRSRSSSSTSSSSSTITNTTTLRSSTTTTTPWTAPLTTTVTTSVTTTVTTIVTTTSLTTSNATTSTAATGTHVAQSTLAARATARASVLTTTTMQTTKATETTTTFTSTSRESSSEGALDDTLQAKRGRMGMPRNPFRERVLQD